MANKKVIAESTKSLTIGTIIKHDIDTWCVDNLSDGRRTHLGASEIGAKCARQIWYKFRWCGNDTPFNGRMLRLFKRGHSEEQHFIRYLQGIGAQIWNTNANGEQFSFSDHCGHFGGSIDGVATLPAKYNINEPILTEYKTQGTGRAFTDLCAKGVKLVKPQHYAQMCVYGAKFQLCKAIYMVVNKNDDDLYVEIVDLDTIYANELIEKSRTIIFASLPPNKIAENPAFFECKFCDFSELCHYGGQSDKNCRSCRNCQPYSSAQWYCNTHSTILTTEQIVEGCWDWQDIAHV